MSDRRGIRCAVFGNGFARSVILPCLRHVDAIRVEGIASPTIERVSQTAREFGIPHAAADHREILQRVRPDLVFVVSPPHRHAAMAIDALEAGAHVVCEKPTALNASESFEMLEASARHPERIALIDHELRFDPRRLRLASLVSGGALGEIRRLDYRLRSSSRRDPGLAWSWWSDAACGGGALGAIGSHAVDFLRLLAGEVTDAAGRLRTFVSARRDPATGDLRPVTADDFFEAWLRHAGGAISSIQVSLIETERIHRIEVVGSMATAILDEQGALRISTGKGDWVEERVEDDLPSSRELGIPDTDWARSFLRMARRLAAAIGAGASRLEGAADFRDGHAIQETLDAIRKAAK